MKIFHRISFGSKRRVAEQLADLNIRPAGDDSFSYFDIDENHERWEDVKNLIEKNNLVDVCTTKFTAREKRDARWLELGPDWHHQYPMPDEDFGYLSATYDLARYCEQCGIGAQQKAPFRMAHEPKWGRRGILQLNWVFDEFFVRPEIWNDIFRPLGIGSRPVLKHKTGEQLATVVQLDIAHVLQEPLNMSDHAFECCSDCLRTKYLPYTRGFFPPLTGDEPPYSAVRTQEWFGSGASAYREILFHGDLRKRIADAGIRGTVWMPLRQD